MISKEHRNKTNKVDNTGIALLKEYDMDQVVLFVRSTKMQEASVHGKNGTEILRPLGNIVDDNTYIEDSGIYCFFGFKNKAGDKVKNICTGDIYQIDFATINYPTGHEKECVPVINVEGQKRPFVEASIYGKTITEDTENWDYGVTSELDCCREITEEFLENGKVIRGVELYKIENNFNEKLHEKYINEKEKIVNPKTIDVVTEEHREKVVKSTQKEREF